MPKKPVPEYISSRSVIVIIAGLFVAMTATVVACLFYFLTAIDHIAANELRMRVNLALKIENEHNQSLLEEYSYWDEAYEKIVIEHDRDWIKNASGEYQISHNGFDFVLAVKSGDQQADFVQNPLQPQLSFTDVMQHAISSMMKMSQLENSATKSTSGYFLIDGSLYAIIGAPFVRETDNYIRPGTYFALGTRVDTQYLATLAYQYQLGKISLTPTPENRNNRIPLYSPDSTPIGTLYFSYDTPREELTLVIAIVLSSFALLSFLIIRRLLQQEQQSRSAYEQKLYFAATRDTLTQVYNRRYFTEMGNKAFKIHTATRRPLSIMLIDLDYFKKINDEYGHKIGDQALIYFSELCMKVLPKSYIFARIGGEEFAVLLPEVNTAQSVQVAEQIRCALAKKPFIYDKKSISITVSIGIASLAQQINLDVLLDQADKALYLAKNAGRNQLQVHPLAMQQYELVDKYEQDYNI